MEYGAVVVRLKDTIIQEGVEYIISKIKKDIAPLDEDSWVVFGASGFAGKWLCLLASALNHYGLGNIRITAVSRDVLRATRELANFFPKDFSLPNILDIQEIIQNGPRSKVLANATTIFYAATSTKKNVRQADESSILIRKIVSSLEDGKNPVFIHLSSGAVYDVPSNHTSAIDEQVGLRKQSLMLNDYQEVKLDLERVLEDATQKGLMVGVNARLFAFIGPGFSLKGNFAASDFMEDALNRRPISINGNPGTVRSYMSPQDLMIWLSHLWAQNQALFGLNVNIGSDEPITLIELANLIKAEFRLEHPISLLNPHDEISSYYPDTSKFKQIFNVPPLIPLKESLRQWRIYLTSS